MPEIETVVTATMLSWLRRACSSSDPWVDFLKWDACKIGGIRAVLRGQKKTYFNDTELSFNRCFFQEIMKLSNLEAGAGDLFMKAAVWENNLFRTPDGKPLPRCSLARKGYVLVEDFVDEDGRIIEAHETLRRGLAGRHLLDWIKAKRAIEARMVGANRLQAGKVDERLAVNPMGVWWECEFPFKGTIVDLTSATHRQLIVAIRSVKAKKRSKSSLNLQTYCGASEEEMAEAWQKIPKVSIGTYARSYHFRIANGLLYGNKDYHRFGHKDSARCGWCLLDRQDSFHTLWDCPATKAFRRRLAGLKLNWNFSKKQALLGTSILSETYIALCINIYIYRSNYYNKILSIGGFRAELANNREVERAIAVKKGKLRQHNKKWSPLESFL